MNPTPLPGCPDPAIDKSIPGLTGSQQTPLPGSSNIEGLYIHIPFCARKCRYCDFYSLPGSRFEQLSLQKRFLAALLKELDQWLERLPIQPRTIFVGGGTPTHLAEELWYRLLEHLAQRGILQQVIEFTVEANPDTVSLPLMQLLQAGGVNRVSIGAQSFQPALLNILGRSHQPEEVCHAVQTAREAGIHNINLDLIFAIPTQTLELLEADLNQALALEPEHLACYALSYEPQTPLSLDRLEGRIEPVPEEVERRMYLRLIERLEQAGYEHYEISNWARRIRLDSQGATSCRCLHNLTYWTNGNWLGLGPAAASHIDGRRWKNQPDLSAYLTALEQEQSPPLSEWEMLEPDRRLGEAIMLGLRLRQGLDWAAWGPRLNADPRRKQNIDHLIQLGLLERTATHLRLSREGLLVADSVIAQLL